MSCDYTIYPLLLEPAFQDYIWGGQRLKTDYGKNSDLPRIAESWECSVHEHGLTKILNGKACGLTLRQYIEEHPEILGKHVKGNRFPLLIKFIDAYQDLSIQVHPNDFYAKKYEDGALGKTEMWYVLSAEKDASLTIGFNSQVDENQIRSGCIDGTIEKYLNRIPVREDDVFMIRPGIVHAIGKGTLILEIQEDSDLTYRLYDYNRFDQNGNKRILHIDKALDVLDQLPYMVPKQPLRTLRYQNGIAKEILLKCKYFLVKRYLVNNVGSHYLLKNDLSFIVLVCIEGCLDISFEEDIYTIYKGNTMFIPCGLTISISGKGKMIEVSC